MKKFFLFFSHSLTESQKANIEKELGLVEYRSLPVELQLLWSNVPPEYTENQLAVYAEPIIEYLNKNAILGDYLLVQGDFGLTFLLVCRALTLGLVPVYATTVRNAIEKVNSEGDIVTTHVFSHVRFRKYST